MELYTSMLKGDSTAGLYKTCDYIKNNAFDKLEEEWINMTAHIGKLLGPDAADTWMHVNAELINMIESDKLSVTNSLVMTAKLYLLFQRVNKIYNEESIKALRDKIIDNFPDDAMLSYAGLQQFSRILPSIDDETYPFYNRILAGLTHLLAQNAVEDIRMSLEYLTRKKMKMPLPNIFPAATLKEAKKGDPAWFLWGAILLHFDEEKVATNFKLFTWNFQGAVGQRNARVGLLWGLAYCIRSNVSVIWNKEELKVIERVKGVARQLWEEMNIEKDETVGIMHSFYPRGSMPLEPLYAQQIDNSRDRNGGGGVGGGGGGEMDPLVNSVKVLKIHTKEHGGSGSGFVM